MKGQRTSTNGAMAFGDLARLRVKTEASVLTLGSGNKSHSLGGWNATTRRRRQGRSTPPCTEGNKS